MDECICKCIRTDTLARYFCISYIDVYWCFCFSTCVWCCFCFLLTATVYAKVSRSLCLTECPVPLTRCILYLVSLALFVDRRLAGFWVCAAFRRGHTSKTPSENHVCVLFQILLAPHFPPPARGKHKLVAP